MTTSLERVVDERGEKVYLEPVTDTIIRKLERYGSGLGHSETAWELESRGEPCTDGCQGACVIARTLTEARDFLEPFVCLVRGLEASVERKL